MVVRKKSLNEVVNQFRSQMNQFEKFVGKFSGEIRYIEEFKCKKCDKEQGIFAGIFEDGIVIFCPQYVSTHVIGFKRFYKIS